MAFLGEQIAPFHLAGGMLVLAGVIMAQTLMRLLRRAKQASLRE
jgi:drug/metabolite transporter (DMT)-like permease